MPWFYRLLFLLVIFCSSKSFVIYFIVSIASIVSTINTSDIKCYSCYQETCPKPWNSNSVDRITSPSGWCLVNISLNFCRIEYILWFRHLVQIIKLMSLLTLETGQCPINVRKINVLGVVFRILPVFQFMSVVVIRIFAMDPVHIKNLSGIFDLSSLVL